MCACACYCVCIYILLWVYIQVLICKLTSELCQNESKTDISVYQIIFPKLHENILKFSRLTYLQTRPPDNFAISCETFWCAPCLNY